MIPTKPDFYKALLDQMSDGVYFVDRDRRILYWNEGAFRLTGYASRELIGRQCQDDILCHVDDTGKHLCYEGCPLSACISDGCGHETRVFLRHKEGRRVPVIVRTQPLLDTDGSIVGGIEIFSDDSVQEDARRRINEMERMAFLDHLTQLPNRRFTEIALQTALSEYRIHGNPFGLLSIDLDGFKKINDSFGHAMGDIVLRETAKTLIASMRPTDIVGRWGGDEFVAIVRSANEELVKALKVRCASLIRQTSVPLPDGRRVNAGASVGATLVCSEDTCAAILSRADELMYLAKSAERQRSHIDSFVA
jgi:diguanylate cyclase (GGDEF)-like protein/PAS domain S-box-containing protein